MSIPISERQRLANEQVGRTEVSSLPAWSLIALFLVTISWVGLGDGARMLSRETETGEGTRAARPIASGGGSAPRRGFLAVNRLLRQTIQRLEDRLEDESMLREILLPPVQLAASAGLGLGNEQVYPGRGDWLFYRADVDHVTAAPFLDRRELVRRSRAGDSWTDPPEPDPLPALRQMKLDLAARGIALIVMPTPLKPAIYPDMLSNRFAAPAEPLRNGSYGAFVAELEALGIEVFDPGQSLLALRREGTLAYLETDTHWTPVAVEHVAERLADRVRRLGVLEPGNASEYFRRPASTEGFGDVAEMLRLPDDQTLYRRKRVDVRMVLDGEGRLWRPDSKAEVLLLGDSFTNVYSDAALGWGTGAGLAEQLSFELGRGIDRIALNAGGALAVRQALRRGLANDPSRLDGKLIIVYQFAARELTQGDWRVEPLQPARRARGAG